MCPPPLLVVTNVEVVRILVLMKMMKGTQTQNNTNFIKDLDLNILPQHFIKFFTAQVQ